MNFKKLYSVYQQKQFRFFIIAFLVSLLMWFMVNLSKNYTKTIPVKINFTNISTGNLIHSTDTLVAVKIQGSGFSLWSNSLKKASYAIDVNLFKDKWNWQQNQYAFKQIFPKSIEVLNVIPNTINFTQFTLSKKKIKVTPNIVVKPQLGYGIISQSIQPDSVFIYGNKKAIKNINTIKTDSLVFENVTQNIEGEIALKLPKQVVQVSDKIKYQYQIDRFTQGEFLVPIQLVNVPKDMEITIFPKQVSVQFESPISLYKKYQTEHFLLTVDCSHINDQKTLPVRLQEKPDGVKNVRLLKKSVTFLVLKK